jgi:hypothetical protein
MLTPEVGPRIGNFLYWWLHAHAEQAKGRDLRVVTPARLDPWLDAFPVVRAQLAVTQDAVRLRDRRTWPAPSLHQRFGSDFTARELADFVQAALLTPLMAVPTPRLPSAAVVVNVRRGDYYADPHLRGLFGIDVRGYLALALGRITDRHPPTHVHVVSDDVQWCRRELADLLHSPGTAVTYADDADPLVHLATLAKADRLVGANSTFSYWGGYVATVRSPSTHIVMPSFHSRNFHDGRAIQLDPSWDAVEELPGGWFGPN